jgi:hypothetical protein
MRELRDDGGPTEADLHRDSSRAFERERPDVLQPEEETVTASVGEPDELAQHWHYQEGSGDCAIYAEGSALEAFGKEFDPERERQAGEREGTYSRNGGTEVAALGHVWQREGIAVERYPPVSSDHGARQLPTADEAFQHLAESLEQRKGVVAAVDSGPLWHDESEPTSNRGHAVWVTGIEQRESGSAYVVCNDSGVLDGQGKRYPIEDFDLAWRRSGYDMVITRDSFQREETHP